MLTNAELKYYSSLLQKKYRFEENKFLVEGYKLIEEAVASGFKCECLISSNLFSESNVDKLHQLSQKVARTEWVKQKDLEKLSDTKTPQGIIGVFNKPSFQRKHENVNQIVALENISDPGNLGTILRNCDWFGFNTIILSGNCSEIYSPKVIRSSAGSVFHLNIIEQKDFYNSLQSYKNAGYNILCSDINGNNIYEFVKAKKTIIVFSNEANGPTEAIIALSDYKITIPKIGKAESLNVASASAVILSELSR
jgi:TrmH family RNA methyltransferase